MRAREFLTESAGSVLYHGTNIASAEGILSDNAMYRGSGPIEGQVSFTRSVAQAVNFGSWQDDAGVILEFDWGALKNKYGDDLTPFDYDQWDPEADPSEYRVFGDEEEVALFQDLPNVDQYLKRIIVLFENISSADQIDQNIINNYPTVLNHPKSTVIVSSETLHNARSASDLSNIIKRSAIKIR